MPELKVIAIYLGNEKSNLANFVDLSRVVAIII